MAAGSIFPSPECSNWASFTFRAACGREERWGRDATRKQIETDNPADFWNCGYGYQFWMSPYPGAYRADGAFGQVTTVLPEKGLVVAVQWPEEGDFEQVKRALHEEILTQL